MALFFGSHDRWFWVACWCLGEIGGKGVWVWMIQAKSAPKRILFIADDTKSTVVVVMSCPYRTSFDVRNAWVCLKMRCLQIISIWAQPFLPTKIDQFDRRLTGSMLHSLQSTQQLKQQFNAGITGSWQVGKWSLPSKLVSNRCRTFILPKRRNVLQVLHADIFFYSYTFDCRSFWPLILFCFKQGNPSFCLELRSRLSGWVV